jgi:hypothetical protein
VPYFNITIAIIILFMNDYTQVGKIGNQHLMQVGHRRVIYTEMADWEGETGI